MRVGRGDDQIGEGQFFAGMRQLTSRIQSLGMKVRAGSGGVAFREKKHGGCLTAFLDNSLGKRITRNFDWLVRLFFIIWEASGDFADDTLGYEYALDLFFRV